jgi:GNAT superfamily N-acetyltransferase
VYSIRGLQATDWEQWQPLWADYLSFYRAGMPDATTRDTFARLSGGSNDMFGLLAIDQRGAAAGLAHCVVHPTTWTREPICYLEDLFVAPSGRGTGLGRSLLERAKALSVERGAVHLYWHTQAYNGRARSLYDQVARSTSFVVYEM